ncbi:transferrin-binding protein-like solute binding protein [Lonepinella sp. BR2474]|uniref:transferrin-binding protein-like solute binding protein n=1 Tax=Lonepinella sp. BR2474 TaxID=3434548 RepID=UPI003F6DB975
MKTLTLTLLVSSMTIALAGCGSSGGGSDDNHADTKTTTNQTVTKPTTSTVQTATNPATSTDQTSTNPTTSTDQTATNPTTSTHQTATTPTTSTNQTITTPSDANSFYTKGSGIKTSKTSDAQNILVIDGQSMELAPGLKNLGGIISSRTGFININGSQISNLTNSPIMYGLRQVDGKYIAFAQGDNLATVPTSGHATYNGKAIIDNASQEDAEKGSATFNVDFGTKKLTGALTFKTNETVNLEATLNGNKFQGDKNNVTTQGAFYGNNASHLTGVFEGKQNNTAVKGAYGAQRE